MAGIGRAGVWASLLVAAVLTVAASGGPAGALDRREPPRCAVRLGAEPDHPWRLERLLRLLADGVENRPVCVRGHRHATRRPPAGPCPGDRVHLRGRAPRR